MSSLARRDEIPALEAALALAPDSLELHLRLIEAHASDPELSSSPRRTDLALWLVRHHPEHPASSTPYCEVDPEKSPEGFQAVKSAWLEAVAAAPENVTILRGAGLFISARDYQEAEDLLLRATRIAPADPQAWLDLGRLCCDPAERLQAFERARALGSGSPNLLAWLARSAAEAGDYARTEAVGTELLAQVEAVRAEYGDALDWPEHGRSLWARARARTGSDADASALVQAMSQGNYDQHAGHTALGLVACHRGDLAAALRHLVSSLEIRPDCRLAAYGPSSALLRALCVAGRGKDVLVVMTKAQHLWTDAVASSWQKWMAQVEHGELPGE